MNSNNNKLPAIAKRKLVFPFNQSQNLLVIPQMTQQKQTPITENRAESTQTSHFATTIIKVVSSPKIKTFPTSANACIQTLPKSVSHPIKIPRIKVNRNTYGQYNFQTVLPEENLIASKMKQMVEAKRKRMQELKIATLYFWKESPVVRKSEAYIQKSRLDPFFRKTTTLWETERKSAGDIWALADYPKSTKAESLKISVSGDNAFKSQRSSKITNLLSSEEDTKPMKPARKVRCLQVWKQCKKRHERKVDPENEILKGMYVTHIVGKMERK
eukprot:TRINITY_DN120764_c0_g1_i1.p1 TRINITY_DN120764_c0_g1~~TRINITY_DN120764_c0_g1_i1.p1  ORF type:complete len:299 (+),score=21.76 TRINITY_DN120764_c0_g1_i1:82-897(+)